MTPEAQQIAIAKACGWKKKTVIGSSNPPMWHHPDGAPIGFVPDYLSDLNAMHEAESTLHHGKLGAYSSHLGMIVGQSIQPSGWYDAWFLLHAAAVQRAEAFLKTLNLWTEDEQRSGTLAQQSPTATLREQKS